MGQAWSSDEENRLLESIKRNTQIKQIAIQHERTPGGITSRLRVIAFNLYKAGTSIEEIQTITGLTLGTVEDVIKRREDTQKRKEEKKERKKIVQDSPPILNGSLTKVEIVGIISDIQVKMARLNMLITMIN
jgi:hypothetical protein